MYIHINPEILLLEIFPQTVLAYVSIDFVALFLIIQKYTERT